MRVYSHHRFLLQSITLAVLLLFTPSVTFAADTNVSLGDIKQQISDLNETVKGKQQTLKELQQRELQYRKAIAQKKDRAATLEEQIAIAENGIAKTQLDIDIAQTELKVLRLEIGVLDGKIRDQEVQIGKDRQLLGTLARRLYSIQFNKSAFEILFTNRSLSAFFDRLQSITDLEAGVQKTLTAVKDAKAALDLERKSRETKRLAMEDNERQLEISRRELEDDRTLKDSLLAETKASELEYRYRLAELKQEQNQADSEITYLENALREKMSVADRLRDVNSVLSWPVDPSRGISTMFHDPGYPFRYVFEHPGLDIRASQGVPVRAAAAGVIARAKNAGMGYSYVMIIHNNDISTVYGHLSRVVAKEDTFVERGEVVGYSGGLPGTPGAGPLTTGPHLHFETRLKGIPVDPLRYLVSL